MDILKALCSVPTAPFAEDRVVQFVTDFVKLRPKLRLTRDATGNLLISLKSTSTRPRWVFTAHMDHPGFVAGKTLGKHRIQALFHGWVRNQYVQHTRVRFFNGPTEIRGVIEKTIAEEYDDRQVPKEAVVRVAGEVPPGSVGMFDVGEGRYAGGKFLCRCCDDLAGAAACLAMLDHLHRRPPTKSPIAVLLTRAEEVGMLGCLAACQKPTLLKKTDRVIAIECSALQPQAPQGKGVIIRVGDRVSIFNSSLTYFLAHQAEQLQKKQPQFNYQRALMPGGVCEATAYDIFGFTAASLCVPLANYHNMDTQKEKIGPEYIDLSDWQNMRALFIHLAQTGHEYQPGHALLKQRILKRYEKLKHLLQVPAATGRW